MTERLDLPHRPRRNRKSPAVRALVRETSLDAGSLVWPVFVQDGGGDMPIDAMPGQARFDAASGGGGGGGGGDGLVRAVEAAAEAGVHAIAVFPKVGDALKTPTGDEAYNDDGLIPRVVRRLKRELPGVVLITDVALDPYSSDGHDGIVGDDGTILNDETVEALCKQALAQARAGADIIAPSDMMDGRVGAIRAALDGEGFTNTSILAYTAKYASAFYGPFRDALDSAPRASGPPPSQGGDGGGSAAKEAGRPSPQPSPFEGEGAKPIPGNKRTYQMDPANAREALREMRLDEAEGADLVMVKPAGAYLDVISLFRGHTTLPVAAYQVSGEYAMLKHAAAAGAFDEREAVLESLLAIRRAGADVILTYFAPQAAAWLAGR